MLDLVFLVLMIIILYKANKGEFAELLYKIALVVGVLAAALGLISSLFTLHDTGGLIHLVVLLFVAALKPVANRFIKLYNDKEAQRAEEYRKIRERYNRDGSTDPVYTDENFNDPELRFGKGGYTDYDD